MNQQPFLIATKEKALCDLLLTLPGHYKSREVPHVLEGDFRIDLEHLGSLDRSLLRAIQNASSNAKVALFLRWYFKTYPES